MGRIGFELLAQLSHQHPKVLWLIHGVSAPDGLQNGTVGKHPIRTARKKCEQIELFGGESNLNFASLDAVAIVVNREIADQYPAGWRIL